MRPAWVYAHVDQHARANSRSNARVSQSRIVELSHTWLADEATAPVRLFFSSLPRLGALPPLVYSSFSSSASSSFLLPFFFFLLRLASNRCAIGTPLHRVSSFCVRMCKIDGSEFKARAMVQIISKSGVPFVVRVL